jgi:hypothetical protein
MNTPKAKAPWKAFVQMEMPIWSGQYDFQSLDYPNGLYPFNWIAFEEASEEMVRLLSHSCPTLLEDSAERKRSFHRMVATYDSFYRMSSARALINFKAKDSREREDIWLARDEGIIRVLIMLFNIQLPTDDHRHWFMGDV